MELSARSVLFCFVLACLACRAPAAEGKPVPAAAALELTDSDLHSEDFQPVADRVTWDNPRFDGLSLSAPRRVDTRTRTSLPLALLEGSNGVRQWDTHPQMNTVLVGLDLTDGTVRAVNAKPIAGKRYDPRTLPRSREGEPLPSASALHAVSLTRFDARKLLSLPWDAGRRAFVFLQQDWRSNLEAVELEGAQAAPSQPLSLSVEGLGELVARTRSLQPLPSFAKRPDSPPVPEEGLSLRIAAQPDAIEAAGSFRLRTPEHARLSKDLSDWLRAKAGKNPVPVSLVRVTVLVLIRDQPTPRLQELLVPVFEEREELAQAHFALGLQTGLDPIPSGDHHVWAVAADQLFGPFPLTVP